MKQGKEDFKIFKKNTKNKSKNYIFQNNKATRSGFYILTSLLIIGLTMVIISGVII
ncbi:hypothetical protein [uncultured Tenacibaculum sp.]|uniref:hypothetical protein n=1 Tax=uncultured Tenacibaculum sp. TaxID=174713 RepID=UPI00260FA190|nr:hypothetical protein [uncultured Tenacibaculum sp.]